MNRTQLKSRSRASILWARPTVLMVCMSYWLIRAVIDWFTVVDLPYRNGLPDVTAILADGRMVATLALGLVVSIAVRPLAAGHDYLYPLRLARDHKAGIRTLFELTERPLRFTVLPILVKGLQLLPLLPAAFLLLTNLLRHGAVLAGLSDQLMTAILSGVTDAYVQDMAGSLLALALPLPLCLALLAGAVLALFMHLTYVMAHFLAIDKPEQGIVACLRGSRRLMAGRRSQLLALELSFLPWFVPMGLCAWSLLSLSVWAYFTLSVAMFITVWALAYRNVTCANYYSLITGQLKRQHAPGILSRAEMEAMLNYRSPFEPRPGSEDAPAQEPEEDSDDDKPPVDQWWKE